MKKYLLCLGLAGILSLAGINSANSKVGDLTAIGARSYAMAGAMVGIADDLLSAFYHNPAGLVQIKGSSMAMGSAICDLRLHYETPEGYRHENDFYPVIPYLAFATDSYGPVTLGVGVFSTLGVGLNFKADPAHGLSGDIKSQSGVMSLNPTLAYQVNPRMALGLQLNIGYGKSKMNQPTPLGYLRTEADGFGLGCTIGVLYEVNRSLKLGLSWRSPMKIAEEGDARLNGVKDDLDIDLYWPQMLTVGLGYKFTPNLIFGFSVKWSDWSYFDRSELKFDKFSALNTPFSEGSRDGLRLQTGVEYWLNQKIALRAGYFYEPYSTDSRYLSPANIDATIHQASLGMGIRLNKLQVDLIYFHTWFVTRQVFQSEVGYPGEYGGDMPAVTLELTYHF